MARTNAHEHLATRSLIAQRFWAYTKNTKTKKRSKREEKKHKNGKKGIKSSVAPPGVQLTPTVRRLPTQSSVCMHYKYTMAKTKDIHTHIHQTHTHSQVLVLTAIKTGVEFLVSFWPGSHFHNICSCPFHIFCVYICVCFWLCHKIKLIFNGFQKKLIFFRSCRSFCCGFSTGRMTGTEAKQTQNQTQSQTESRSQSQSRDPHSAILIQVIYMFYQLQLQVKARFQVRCLFVIYKVKFTLLWLLTFFIFIFIFIQNFNLVLAASCVGVDTAIWII